MKEEKEQRASKPDMASTGTTTVQAQQPIFPTPSPFSISVASTTLTSRPSIHTYTLILRFLAFLFSFVSALSLAITSPNNKNHQSSSRFSHYPDFLYCFIVSIIAFGYSVYQLFTGIRELADRGVLMSAEISDYTSFILDQLVGYLLFSSSSVGLSAINKIEGSTPLWKSAIVSVTISFATFLVVAICALLSGHKLCKRIIW
ncbi:hypothetical protein UlMin_001957 [Ulmus minor]